MMYIMFMSDGKHINASRLRLIQIQQYSALLPSFVGLWAFQTGSSQQASNFLTEFSQDRLEDIWDARIFLCSIQAEFKVLSLCQWLSWLLSLSTATWYNTEIPRLLRFLDPSNNGCWEQIQAAFLWHVWTTGHWCHASVLRLLSEFWLTHWSNFWDSSGDWCLCRA